MIREGGGIEIIAHIMNLYKNKSLKSDDEDALTRSHNIMFVAVGLLTVLSHNNSMYFVRACCVSECLAVYA